MMKNPRNANENLPARQCRLCGHANRPFAKFCGSCGNDISANSSTIELASTGFNFYRRFLTANRKTTLAAALGLFIAGASFFGIHELKATQESAITWGQVRTFVSKAYRLTNAELDALFARIIKNEPSLSAKLDANRYLELEQAIRNRLRDNRVELFPNPFFAKPDRTLRGSGKTPFVFSDIPFDHPAYQALATLIDIGMTCTDEEKRLRPYDHIKKNEWATTVGKFSELLGVKLHELQKYIELKNDYAAMNNFELNEFFNLMRKKFSLPPKETFAWASDPYYPGRLEAFAALSSLIGEID